jgi:hypothetical protein
MREKKSPPCCCEIFAIAFTFAAGGTHTTCSVLEFLQKTGQAGFLYKQVVMKKLTKGGRRS